MKLSAMFRAISLKGLTLAAILFMTAPAAPAQTACNQPTQDVVSVTTLPGEPFAAIPTKDGCTIFVSMTLLGERKGHIAVLNRSGGTVTLSHDIATNAVGFTDMALSRDGRVLAAADGKGVMLFDTAKLLAGNAVPITEAIDYAQNPQLPANSFYVAITPDDKLLFVSDENSAAITVYDFDRLKNGEARPIGRISVGNLPTGLVLSPDGKRLYSTSESAQPDTSPATCVPPAGSGPNLPQGLLTVVDVAKAAIDPAGAVLAKMLSGCDPVRVTLSKDGSRAFVTTRGADSLRIYDTAKVIADADRALVATIAVGKSPVGVATAADLIFTADSGRFVLAGRKGEWLSVIDASSNRLVGNVPAGLFPRELNLTQDGKTLLVSNVGSSSLQLVDLARLTPAYFAQQKPIKDADAAEQAKADAALQARVAAKQPSPGSEAALRKFIASIRAKAPIYDELTPNVATIVHATAAALEKQIEDWGALQSITLITVTREGADVYEVDFEHQKTQWRIVIGPDGKIGPMTHMVMR